VLEAIAAGLPSRDVHGMASSRHDRLAAIIDALRGNEHTTAEQLAQTLAVSVRTLHRDLARLRSAGVAVAGRTGVGLRIPKSAKTDVNLAAVEGATVIEARVRATPKGLRLLGEDPRLTVERGGGALRVVRAHSKDALVFAALRASGEVVVVSPEKIRREVRVRAREVARAHKDDH
jgi:predicted DNA-binding transcriptional regulator YafY